MVPYISLRASQPEMRSTCTSASYRSILTLYRPPPPFVSGHVPFVVLPYDQQGAGDVFGIIAAALIVVAIRCESWTRTHDDSGDINPG